MNRSLTLRSKIFICYSLFVLLLIIGLIISIYVYFSNLLNENASRSMNQSVKSISQQLDTLIENMDNTSNVILYNRELQDILFDTLDFKTSRENYFDINLDKKKKANNILFSILGTKNTPNRVCIYNGMNNFISVSTIPDSNTHNYSDLRTLPWLKLIEPLNVYSIILPTHKDPWADEIFSTDIISFIRKIYYTSGGSSLLLGYLEIQQPYSIIENICRTSASENSRTYIKDENGGLIYPIDVSEEENVDFYFSQSGSYNLNGSFLVKNPKNQEEELVYKSVSQVSNWSVIQVMDVEEFMSPIKYYQKIIILCGGVLIAISLLIMLLITNSLTSPLKKLRKSLQDVTLSNPLLNISMQGSNNEIILLNTAFNQTLLRLQEAMNQIIESHTREYQAHFQALQTQMDPHFLYNSLMGISAVAQENEDYKAVEMCIQLSRMLRYTASYDSPTVTISEEIRYAQSYINMMKYRYEDKLSFEFLIDDSMSEIKVPKLIIQPLIENAFSHGFSKTNPPYKLTVKGIITGDKWEITTSDNGSGFDNDSLERIRMQISEYEKCINDFKYENKLSVGGMAIFNIYIRLKILYGEHTIFSLSNNNEGAQVTIGGLIVHERSDIHV